tara:strand:+ start:1403 stop:1663 length:261 start_codon:yes stop_codon:yes gene_type:complete
MKTPQVTPDWKSGIYIGNGTIATPTVNSNDANARLIAAAPAILAILERILYAHDTGNCGLSNGRAVLCRDYADQARAAIAKAGGAL